MDVQCVARLCCLVTTVFLLLLFLAHIQVISFGGPLFRHAPENVCHYLNF